MNYTIFVRKCNFSILCCHAEETRYPNPKESAGTTPMNSGSNTGDISYTYGGGERCGKRLKVGDIAFIIRIVKFPSDYVKGVFELYELDELQPDSQVNSGAEEKHYCKPGLYFGAPPNISIDVV